MWLAGGATDVGAVVAGPADDGQTAGAAVARVGRAGVAEQRVADAAGRDGGGKLLGRDERAPSPVRQDEDGAPVAGDQLADLGGRAGGELIAGGGVVGMEVGGQGGEPGVRQRAGAAGVLRRMGDGGDGGHERHGEHGAKCCDGHCLDSAPALAQRHRQPCAERRRDRRVEAREVARAQVGHRAAEDDPADEPRGEGEQPATGDAVQPPRPPERQRRRQRRERGDRLDPDPATEVRLGREQPRGRRRARTAGERDGVLARGSPSSWWPPPHRCGSRDRGRPGRCRCRRARPATVSRRSSPAPTAADAEERARPPPTRRWR